MDVTTEKSTVCVVDGRAAFESQNESYIYICGIEPTREISINDHITLMPVQPAANPDDMIDCYMKNGNGSEFEMGILISTLRMVTAQLRITADSPETLAIRTWNSQSICVQIGALLKCEVSWYFQSNDPADKFNAKTQMSLICPNMYKFPSEMTIIDETRSIFLEKYLPVALNLERDDRYGNASNALWCYRMHYRPAIKMSVLWGGIESLFMIEKDIKKTLSVAASRFICGDDSMVSEIKSLYKSRSKAVHEFKNAEKDIEEKSAELLHQLIVACVERHCLPSVSRLLNP